MISGNIIKYFDEAIKIESNLAEMYLLFSQKFPEDRLFWWTISLEEKNHSSLIESEKLFYEVNAFPDELFALDLEELVNINNSYNLLMEHFNDYPTREVAFKIALEMEDSAIEMNYQKLAESSKNTRAINLFKQLNRADKDHAKRITDYMNKKNKI